jgi:hypothetical protein
MNSLRQPAARLVSVAARSSSIQARAFSVEGCVALCPRPEGAHTSPPSRRSATPARTNPPDASVWKKKEHAVEEQYFNKLDKDQRAAFANKLHACVRRRLLARARTPNDACLRTARS